LVQNNLIPIAQHPPTKIFFIVNKNNKNPKIKDNENELQHQQSKNLQY
jgi:hypothetical protein